MNNFLKRGLAVIFAVVMVFSSLATTGFAADNTASTTQTPQWKTVILNIFDFILNAYERIENEDYYDDEIDKSGIFGFLYEPKGMYFYTAADPWQRNVGYNAVFDALAPSTLITFETTRLCFEYGKKDWMIQLWKGQYGMMFYGTEVGVYTKPKDRDIKHYDAASDSEMLSMSLDFNVKYGERWVKRFSRPYDEYWWCTGFLAGNKREKFDDLKVDLKITAKDSKMLKGIRKALKENKISYTAKGLDVYFSY